MNRTILSIIITSLLLSSCDNRDEFFDSINYKPKLSFIVNRDLRILDDSIKVSSAIKSGSYDFGIRSFDENDNLGVMSVEQISGQGRLMLEGSELRESILPVNDMEMLLSYTPRSEGLHRINIIQEDGFSLTDTIRFNLMVFKNVKPKADLKIFYRGVRSPYEYILSAEDSYDQDETFGGEIQAYEYIVNGVRVPQTVNEKKWIFEGRGIHTVQLRVLDNDNEWSTIVEEEVIIQ
jgi:hypothetical protein